MASRNWMHWKTKWMTAEYEVIRIRDMEDRHLRNTVCMLIRWADRELLSALSAAFSCSTMFGGGGIAEDQIDAAIDNLIDMRPADYAYKNYPPFPRMVEEAAKRGMTI